MPNTITWTLPAGTPPANSLLLFPGGTANQLAYANFATTGNVTATYSAGLITLALTGSPSFTGATTFSVGASPVLQLASGGGQSAVAITSAGSGGSPSLAVTGRLEFERPNCVCRTFPDHGLNGLPGSHGFAVRDRCHAELLAAGPDPNINLTLSARGSGVMWEPARWICRPTHHHGISR